MKILEHFNSKLITTIVRYLKSVLLRSHHYSNIFKVEKSRNRQAALQIEEL